MMRTTKHLRTSMMALFWVMPSLSALASANASEQCGGG